MFVGIAPNREFSTDPDASDFLIVDDAADVNMVGEDNENVMALMHALLDVTQFSGPLTLP